MTTYFITGGEGFIGYHLIPELLKNSQHKIVSYDAQKHYIHLTKSRWPFYLEYRIRTIKNPQLVMVRSDTTDRGLLKEILERYQPDIVIHLAALPVAAISDKYPEEARRNILEGTIVLLDTPREVGSISVFWQKMREQGK